MNCSSVYGDMYVFGQGDFLTPVDLAWSLALAFELACTLTPTVGGASSRPTCAIGFGSLTDAVSAEGWMNVALYVPLPFCGVWAFGRPIVNIAACTVLSAVTEITQTLTPIGRACDAADFTDNTVGAIFGALAALVMLRVRKRSPHSGRRDLIAGGGILGIGLASVATVAATSISLGPASPGYDTAFRLRTTLARETATALFGEGTSLETMSVAAADAPATYQVMRVTTDRGTFQLRLPDGHLLAMAALDNRADDGTLNADQLAQVGHQFIHTWFPDIAANTQESVTLAGHDGEALILSYRRHNPNNVLMPLGLDVAVSAGGRILSANARIIDDPAVGRPVVKDDDAKRVAVQSMSGGAAGTAFLLTQKVGGI